MMPTPKHGEAYDGLPLSQTGMGPAITPRPQQTGVPHAVPVSQTGLGPTITPPLTQAKTHQTVPLSQTGMGPPITAPPQQSSASAASLQAGSGSGLVSQSALGPAITPAGPRTTAVH